MLLDAMGLQQLESARECCDGDCRPLLLMATVDESAKCLRGSVRGMIEGSILRRQQASVHQLKRNSVLVDGECTNVASSKSKTRRMTQVAVHNAG